MKKRGIALLMAVFLVCSLFGCGKKEGKEKDNDGLKKITVVLDWTPNTNHTGIYVAQEKGYFKEAGLEVEVVQPPEDGAEVLVASGKAQFGISFQDSMASALAGENPLPITAVAAVIQHNTSGIISRKGEEMDRPKGMEDHCYATWNGPIELATVKQVVEKDGGDFDKISLVPSTVTDEVTALKLKEVDAIWVYYAWAGIKTEIADLATDYFAFADIDPVFDYYTPVIIAGNRFLEKEPETAKSFLEALSKGYEDAIENPEEAADILCQAVPELEKELVLASQKYLADQYQAEAKQWGVIDAERWNRFYEWVNENHLTEEEVPLDTAFSNEYLPER